MRELEGQSQVAARTMDNHSVQGVRAPAELF